MSVVTVGSFDDALLAHIAKGRLQAEGVVSYVADEHYIWANWSMSLALGGVKIQVNINDAETAKEILNKLNCGEYEDNLDLDAKGEVCKGCDGKLVRANNSWLIRVSQLLIYIAWGVILRIYSRKQVCKKCGTVQQ